MRVSELVEVEVDQEVADDNHDSPALSDSSSSPDPENVPLSQLLGKQRVVRNPASGSGVARVFHSRLLTVHRVRLNDETRLSCGRILHSGFKSIPVEARLNFDYHECAVCFGIRTSEG